MKYEAFLDELALQGKVIAITRAMAPKDAPKLKGACALAALNRVLKGETVTATQGGTGCSGSDGGFGLRDDMPNIPGGFGHFISCGRGEGYPAGERIKDSPETGEAMWRGMPQNVSGGFDAVVFSPYPEAHAPELVSILANPDQLAALVQIFCFEKPDYDNVIMPMVSGCASVVRVPLGELAKGDKARAVVGNVDVFSRPHFPADAFFFTIPAAAFHKMLQNADESVLASPIWRGVRKRLHSL